MRALLQRVSEASVSVEGRVTGEIKQGLLVLLGVAQGDDFTQVEKLVYKVIHLRVFADQAGKMNLSLLDVNGELLIVSQFTLYAETRKGNRPSYSQAASPETALRLYDNFVETSRRFVTKVATGVFQAYMQVRIVNDGPVTLICDSNQ